MPEMVQQPRGIRNYMAPPVVALRRPRERLLRGEDPTASQPCSRDVTARLLGEADLTARAVFDQQSAGTFAR